MTTHLQHALHSAAGSARISFSSWATLPESSFSALASRLRAYRQPLRHALLLGSAALLVACGGGSGGGGGAAVPPDGGVITPPDVAAPGAPATPAGLSLGAAGIKTLNFQWTAVDGATHYQLLEDLDGTGTASSPVAISTSIAATQYGHEVPLYTRLNATYTLKACNALGCSASSPAFQPSIANLNAAIGYAKATQHVGADYDFYGGAVALSRDGQILAVGASVADIGAAAGAGAVYVMRRTSAGVWTAPQKLVDSTPNSDEYFGSSLALSADGAVLAVGVQGDVSAASHAGSVQLFTFQTATQAYISAGLVLASNPGYYDWFGQSVALSDDGNVLAVGAPQEDSAVGMNWQCPPNPFEDLDPAAVCEPDSGAVYVYRRAGGVGPWLHQQSIKASNASAGVDGDGDRFGYALALSGDGLTLAVGAETEDSGGDGIFADTSAAALSDDTAANAGAVYVFSRASVDADFGNQVYIKASNSGAQDVFGFSVALSQNGAVLAVGATWESSSATGINGDQANNDSTSSGAVYVFARVDGVWSQQAYVKASNTSQNAYFGHSVALSSDGSTMAVGSNEQRSGTGTGLGADPQASPSPGKSQGALYVFQRSVAGTWAQSAYIKSPTIKPADVSRQFGFAVALSGDGGTLATSSSAEANASAPVPNPRAGAPAVETGVTGSGAVYLF